MDKKKIKSAASFKEQAKQSTGMDNDNLFLPEVPSFLPSLDSVKNGPQCVSFERDLLYENERIHTAILNKSVPHLEGDDTRNSCDSLTRAWAAAKHIPCATYDSLLTSDQHRHVDPISAVKTKSNAQEFESLFAFGDVMTREAEQLCAAEAFCESLARDVVNKGASLYAARCLDAVEEGYTALSVWEDIREEVARAFLPFDMSDNSDGRTLQKKPGDGTDALQVLDVPLSDILVDFTAHLHASKRRERYEACVPSAGLPPPGVPLDEYSRHIMRLEDANALEAETTPPEATKSRKLPHSASSKDKSSVSSPAVTSDTKMVEHQTPVHKLSPTTPPQNTLKTKTKKKLTSTKVSGKPSGSSGTQEGGTLSTDTDDLTTALKQLPPGYFASSYPARKGSTALHGGSPNASAKLQSTRRVSRNRQGSTGATATSLKKSVGVVDIEGNRALTSKNGKSKSTNRLSVDRGDHGVFYKIVNNEAKTAPPPQTAQEVANLATNTAQRKGAKAESSTYKDKDKQEKQRELNRQKEYEDTFVETSANESTDVGVEVTPAPGVSISQSTGTGKKTHGASSTAKGGKSVKGGGEFVPTAKRDSLSYTGSRENERMTGGARLSSTKASLAPKESAAPSDSVSGRLPAVRPKK